MVDDQVFVGLHLYTPESLGLADAMCSELVVTPFPSLRSIVADEATVWKTKKCKLNRAYFL